MLPQQPGPGNSPQQKPARFATAAGRGMVAPVVGEALDPLLAVDPATWTGPEWGLETVKQSTVRTVLRGEVGPPGARLPVHVKLYRAERLSDRARDLTLGSRGENEFRNLLAARELGLPVPEPLCAGALAGSFGARSFLITRTVSGARDYDGLAESQRRAGALLRRVHDLGLVLQDFHPGNVVLDGAGDPWLVDLTVLGRAGTVPAGERARALAAFCLGLDAGPLDPAVRDLLGSYLEAGPALPSDFGQRLAQATRRARLRGLSAFGRRATRPCRHTEVERGGHGAPRWFFFRSGDPAVDERQRGACRAFAAEPGPPHKSGRRGAVWLLEGLAVKGRESAKARALFRAAYWCHFAGVPCAEPVALHLRSGTGLAFSRRAGDRSLAEELAAGALQGAQLTATAARIGDALGRLHAHGLRNRDLKLDNLVRDPASGSVRLVDLDGLRHKRPSDRRGQGADIGRLLAAWRGAGEPGGSAVVRAFTGAYLRARARLLQPIAGGNLWRSAERRAREWASAHR